MRDPCLTCMRLRARRWLRRQRADYLHWLRGEPLAAAVTAVVLVAAAGVLTILGCLAAGASW